MNILQDDHRRGGGGDGDMLAAVCVGVDPTLPNAPLIVGGVKELVCGVGGG